ncbi:hypothetical protein Bhyg_17673, partial [Pseudolycoriella hygida]
NSARENEIRAAAATEFHRRFHISVDETEGQANQANHSMIFKPELVLQSPLPIIYKVQNDNNNTSLDSVDDNFDFDVNVDENHFALTGTVPTIF